MLFARDPGANPAERRGAMNRLSSVVLILWVAWLGTACVVIEDGEVGVSKSFGTIRDEPLLQGVAFVIPVARHVETWNVKLQELKETAQVPSSEGLIVGLETPLLFQVVPEKAPQIRKTVGWNYVDRLVVPYFRNALRDVVSGYPVKNIYGEQGRKEIAAKMRGFLRENLEPRGIEVVDVLLRDVRLPARFKESIEAKLTAEQRVTQKQFETLSDSYLHYLWIKTLNENPNVIYVSSEANMPIFKSVGGK
jgi:regulator of protease activity HflC (stomatin/prohibitin superfamily)